MPPQLELGFSQNSLDRSGAEHEGAALVASAGDARTRWVAVAGESAILLRDGEAASALMPPDRLAAEEIRARVFLGRRGERQTGAPVVAVGLDPARADALREEPDLLVTDLRSIAIQGLVPSDEIGTLAQAKSLLSWHARHRFCAQCGIETAIAQAGLRRDCPNCGTEHFPRTDPVAIMLIARGEHCLLGRQARFLANSYSCLAGFVSPGETIEDAVRREVKEEAGLRVGPVRYLMSQPWPFPSSLMIGCLGTTEDEAITIDPSELEAARWFARDEAAAMLERRHPDGLLTPPPMAIAHHLIRAWVDGATA